MKRIWCCSSSNLWLYLPSRLRSSSPILCVTDPIIPENITSRQENVDPYHRRHCSTSTLFGHNTNASFSITNTRCLAQTCHLCIFPRLKRPAIARYDDDFARPAHSSSGRPSPQGQQPVVGLEDIIIIIIIIIIPTVLGRRRWRQQHRPHHDQLAARHFILQFHLTHQPTVALPSGGRHPRGLQDTQNSRVSHLLRRN